MNVFKGCGVEWAAVADVYEPNLQEGLKIAGDKAQGYDDYRKLLERKDLDAVLIASPEHWHCKHLIDALAAGKDVYCEKPMCWSIEQGNQMVQAVRKSDRIVQIGMQRRSSPIIRDEIKKYFDDKALGDIHLVRAEWVLEFSASIPTPKSTASSTGRTSAGRPASRNSSRSSTATGGISGPFSGWQRNRPGHPPHGRRSSG